jgi:pimeloyl-ACP methyl ester carboxylesterase
MIGDDELCTLDHFIALFRAIPTCELAVVPGASHGLVWEKPSLASQLALDFLNNEPVPTFVPMRRAAKP